MKHTKYKTIQFDDQYHVLRRIITGNVTDKNVNNINKVISSRSKIYNCEHNFSSSKKQYEGCGCLKSENWIMNKIDDHSVEIIIILWYNN